MSSELPLPPDYPFPDKSSEDRYNLDKIFEYADAISVRNRALEKAGWQGEGAYFAGHIQVMYRRSANKITIDPDEAVLRLGIDDGEGALFPGYSVYSDKGQLIFGYDGLTDDTYFATMDHLIDWSEELSKREKNAPKRERFTHLLRRANILR